MGQKLGKANLVPQAEPFANVSRAAITLVWNVFNDVADGFGVSREEVEEICADLKDELNISKLALVEKSGALFTILDTDKNGLIDALEFISTLAALSGMRIKEILEFILSCYDFDGTQQLSVDEVTLALKSASTGLCKLSGEKYPREETIEQLVSEMFQVICGNNNSGDALRVRIPVLAEHLTSHPDVITWYNCFGEPKQFDIQKHETLVHEIDYNHENPTYQLPSNQWQIMGKTNDAIVHQWHEPVSQLTPSSYANTKLPHTAPDATLEVEWIYGYQAERCRNNLRYLSARGHAIVYNVGRYAVVYNFDSHKQSVFSAHNHEIISLAVHPEGAYVATGDSAPQPRLMVWDSYSKKILFSESGFHVNGVAHLAFSMDGQLLASVGLDAHHSVAVHRWKDKELVFTSQVDKGKCLACSFLTDTTTVSSTLAVGGDAYLYLWSKTSEGYIKRRGNFSRHVSQQAITSIAPLDMKDSFVTGTVSGLMLLWTDRNCVRHIKGHQGSVNVLYSSPHGVISGGRDRRIRLWTHRLDPGATFDMSHFGLNPSIRSACMSLDGSSILVGTLAGEVYEISAVDGSDLRGGAVTSSHSTGYLRNIAVHPHRLEFATVGDDKCLRIWDATTRSLLKIATFDADARTVCYSPVGDVLAVGLGGDRDVAASAGGKCGAYVIINEEDLSVVHEAKDSIAAITYSLFSPEGETLILGADDGAIYVYAVQDEYELIGRCIRHTGPICAVDFSKDGEWIRSNASNGELFFFNCDDASVQTNMGAMRDVQWATSNCIYSWHAKGLHNNLFNKEHILVASTPATVLEATAQSSSTTPADPKTYHFMAAASNLGYLNMRLYPCVVEEAEYHRFCVHVGSVASIVFSHDSAMLISCGEFDRCIVQWKCRVQKPELVDGVEIEPVVLDVPESEDYGLEMRGASDIDEDVMIPDCAQVAGLLNDVRSHEAKELTPPSWREAIVEPNNIGVIHSTAPDLSLVLNYVYGYHAQDMRNNLRYTVKGDIVFVAGAVGVVMNRTTKAQRFFQNHSQSISAFACSKDGSVVATGEIGHKPAIAVWDASTCATLTILPDLQYKAITALAFSNNGHLLAAVGLDTDHTLTVYDWQNNIVLCRAYIGAKRISGVCFSPSDSEILVCGIKDIQICVLSTWELSTMKASLEEGGKVQPYLSCAYFRGFPTVGTADGHIYSFEDGKLRSVIKAHDGGVHAMDVSFSGEQMVTGGKDGLVKLWNTTLDCIKEYAVENLLNNPPISCRVRSVAFSKDGDSLLIGTRAAEVIELRLRNSSVVGGKPILHGHGARELWGLAAHPTKEEFITTSDDSTIRLWDAKSCSMVKCTKLEIPSRCVAYSPDGKVVAVGLGNGKRSKKGATKDGTMLILDSHNLKMLHEAKDSNEAIRCARFSSDGKILAIGSDDGKVYLYNVKDHYSRRATISCHRAPLVSVDFTHDTQFLMSTDVTKRVCYSETTSGAYVPSAAALRDAKWATWTSTIGWPTLGVWEMQPTGAEPTAVQKSWSGSLLASGNSAGRIYVVHNPCPEMSGFTGDRGHAGTVSNVAWLAGDGMLISVGAKDHTILQWKCCYDDARESGDEGGISCDDSEIERDGGHEFSSFSANKKSRIEGLQPPWMANVVPPTNIRDDNITQPALDVELEFVHGIRSGDCRNTVRYNEDGNVVYFSSTIGIIYDRKHHSQLFYQGHRNAIISIDLGLHGKIAATGELAFDAEIHLWDARTAASLSSFAGIHRHGVTSLSFSPSGASLVSLGQDTMNSVVILSSPSKRWIDDVFVQYSVNLTPLKMFWIRYSSEDMEYPITAGGKRCLFFLKPVGKVLEKKKGTFGRRRKLQAMLCSLIVSAETPTSTADNGEVQHSELTNVLLTGTVTGLVYVWKNHRVDSTITAHDAPIFALANIQQGFATGGKDGYVKLWSLRFQQLHSYNLQSFQPSPFNLSVHSLATNHLRSKMTIVARSGEMYELTLSTHTPLLVMESHSHRELHGLTLHPKNSNEYLTIGDDGVLRLWNFELKKCIRRSNIEVACRAVAWSPDGQHIAVGVGGDPSMTTKDGALMILNGNTLDVVFEDRKAKLTISDINYSPNGELLTVASRDGKVYIHECGISSTQQYKLRVAFELPSKESYVMKIDYNTDSSIIRLTTSKQELLHYQIRSDDVELLPLATTVRDEVWHTTNCTFGFSIKGLWGASNEMNDLTAVDVYVDGDKGYVCGGYEQGDIRLYNYPCQNFGAAYLSLHGGSGLIPNLKFSRNGRHIVSLDSTCRTIIQYKLVSKK